MAQERCSALLHVVPESSPKLIATHAGSRFHDEFTEMIDEANIDYFKPLGAAACITLNYWTTDVMDKCAKYGRGETPTSIRKHIVEMLSEISQSDVVVPDDELEAIQAIIEKKFSISISDQIALPKLIHYIAFCSSRQGPMSFAHQVAMTDGGRAVVVRQLVDRATARSDTSPRMSPKLDWTLKSSVRSSLKNLMPAFDRDRSIASLGHQVAYIMTVLHRDYEGLLAESDPERKTHGCGALDTDDKIGEVWSKIIVRVASKNDILKPFLKVSIVDSEGTLVSTYTHTAIMPHACASI